MRHWLYHYDNVRGEPERLAQVLRQQVRRLLAQVLDAGDHDVGGDGAADHDAAGHAGQGHGEITPEGDVLARLPAHVLGLDVHKAVRLHTGVAERRQDRTCIALHWHAEPGRHLFPTFDGTIELEPQSADSAHLAIAGAATLPLGPVGGAADAVALGAVAERTVRYVTERLAAALEGAAMQPHPADGAADDPPNGLRVRHVMTSSPLVLHEDMPVKTAALLLFHYDVAGAPVRDDSGALVGVLSEADLLDAEAPLRHGMGRDVAASWRRHAARTVGEACSRPARQVRAGASLRSAAAIMRDLDIARLVVVEGSEIAGMVSRHDVLKALVRTDAEVQASVDRLLAREHEGAVRAVVEWGVAYLTGRVSTRSGASDLVTRVVAIDGVIGAETDLTWDVDDVLPSARPS